MASGNMQIKTSMQHCPDITILVSHRKRNDHHHPRTPTPSPGRNALIGLRGFESFIGSVMRSDMGSVIWLVRRSALGSSQLAKVTFLNILKVFWDPVFVGQMSGTMSATTMSSRRWKSGSVTYELSDGRTGVGARDACVSNIVVSKFSSCTTTTSVRYRAARAAVPEPSNLLFPMGRLALVLV